MHAPVGPRVPKLLVDAEVGRTGSPKGVFVNKNASLEAHCAELGLLTPFYVIKILTVGRAVY